MKIDWKHILDWDVVALKAPEAVVQDGKTVGYRVVVGYKYHGQDVEFYSLDDPRLYKVWVGPKDAAQASYKEHLRKMGKQQERERIKAQRLKTDWRHIFNWDVTSVESPREVIENGRVIGYNVVVTYKHHGKDTEFYSTDDDRMYTTYVSPQAAAMEAYNAHKRRIKEQNRTR